MSSIWTPELIVKLKRLAALPLSAQQIAERLSHKNVSRSAVISKLMRLGIPLYGTVPGHAKPKSASRKTSKAIDLTGNVFGKLTVMGRGGDKNKQVLWLCRCECGTDCKVSGNRLRNGCVQCRGCAISGDVPKRGMRPATRQSMTKQSALTGALIAAHGAPVARSPSAPYRRREPLPLTCEPVGILALLEANCRWVLDIKGEDGMALFCGAGTDIGRSFCEGHHRIAFETVNERRARLVREKRVAA